MQETKQFLRAAMSKRDGKRGLILFLLLLPFPFFFFPSLFLLPLLIHDSNFLCGLRGLQWTAWGSGAPVPSPHTGSALGCRGGREGVSPSWEARPRSRHRDLQGHRRVAKSRGRPGGRSRHAPPLIWPRELRGRTQEEGAHRDVLPLFHLRNTGPLMTGLAQSHCRRLLHQCV